MNTLIEKIEDFFRRNEVSVYGTCGIETVKGSRAGYSPSDIMPSAKGIVCMALPFPKGIYQCQKNMEIPYWWNSNLFFDNIDTIMLKLCNIIEQEGYQALPVNGCFPIDATLESETLGYVNLIHLGAAVNIGKIGKNALLFNSRYGPRLILGGIVTSAPLPAVTVPDEGQQGCPEDCFVCVQNCPVNAIDGNGNIDIVKCMMYSARNPVLWVIRLLNRVVIPFLSMLKLVDKKGLYGRNLQRLINLTYANNHSMFACINCVSMCPYRDSGLPVDSTTKKQSSDTL